MEVARAAGDHGDADEREGEWRPMFVRGPREQTKEEREEHAVSHLPFRNWCRRRARGRGREWPHMRFAEKPGPLGRWGRP